MTREEAKRRIDSIDFYLQHHTDDYSERDHDAMMMAISALEHHDEFMKRSYEQGKQDALSQEPTVKPMTVDEMEREYEKSKALFHKIVESDDAINRQAVLEMAYDMSEIDGEHFTESHMVVDVEDIQKLPPVTQKSGKVQRWKVRQRNDRQQQTIL